MVRLACVCNEQRQMLKVFASEGSYWAVPTACAFHVGRECQMKWFSITIIGWCWWRSTVMFSFHSAERDLFFPPLSTGRPFRQDSDSRIVYHHRKIELFNPHGCVGSAGHWQTFLWLHYLFSDFAYKIRDRVKKKRGRTFGIALIFDSTGLIRELNNRWLCSSI